MLKLWERKIWRKEADQMSLRAKIAKLSSRRSWNQTKLLLKVKHNLKILFNVINVEDPILDGIVHGLDEGVINVDGMAIMQLFVIVGENLRSTRYLSIFKMSPRIKHLKMDDNKIGDKKSLEPKNESTHLCNNMPVLLTRWWYVLN